MYQKTLEFLEVGILSLEESSPTILGSQKERIVFQPSIFRGDNPSQYACHMHESIDLGSGSL